MGESATTFDARPGGAIRLDYGKGDVMLGTFVEVARPRRLVFTWGWEKPADPTPVAESRVEVDIEPDGTGSILRLRHSGLDPDAVAAHAQGWDHFLGRLVDLAATA